MASSTFSGPVTSTNGFIGNVTGNVTGDATLSTLTVTTIDADSATSTLVSNAATITKRFVVVTTEALTTAAGATQALVLTLTGHAAADLAFVEVAGGTNTKDVIVTKAVSTTNTLTITLKNREASDALDGTVKLNVMIVKA